MFKAEINDSRERVPLSPNPKTVAKMKGAQMLHSASGATLDSSARRHQSLALKAGIGKGFLQK